MTSFSKTQKSMAVDVKIQYHTDGDAPPIGSMWIFVFGSNLSGIHGAGAAAHALHNFGAVWGQGYGFSGRSFAIPTKDYSVRRSLPFKEVEKSIFDFFTFVAGNRGNVDRTHYWITRVGCGLAGFEDRHIAPLFHSNLDRLRTFDNDLVFSFPETPHVWKLKK
jgi:hypothetical protein